MAASLMKQGKIQRVFVGADRVAINGDFANKIGTYNMAVVAKHHNVPFHPVSPLSTVDFECKSGEEIHIEHRSDDEVRGWSRFCLTDQVRGAFGTIWAPKDAKTHNPCFDVTPVDLVTSLVLDVGILSNEQLKQGQILNWKK